MKKKEIKEMADVVNEKEEVKAVVKYTLDKNDTIKVLNPATSETTTLYRVRYNEEYGWTSIDRASLASDYKGGYIENESCLSQSGMSRIGTEVVLFNNVTVSENATVTGSVMIAAGDLGFDIRNNAKVRVGHRRSSRKQTMSLNKEYQPTFCCMNIEHGMMKDNSEINVNTEMMITATLLQMYDNTSIAGDIVMQCNQITMSGNAQISTNVILEHEGTLCMSDYAHICRYSGFDITSVDSDYITRVEIPKDKAIHAYGHQLLFDKVSYIEPQEYTHFASNIEAKQISPTITLSNNLTSHRTYAYNILTDKWMVGCKVFNSTDEFKRYLSSGVATLRAIEEYTYGIKYVNWYIHELKKFHGEKVLEQNNVKSEGLDEINDRRY